MSTIETQVNKATGRRATETTDRAHSTSEILHLLSNARRRFTIEHLNEHNTSEFDVLVDAVTARENGKIVEDITPAERKRVYSSLRQSHLNQLADAGVIEFDDRGGTIRPGAEFGVFVEYLSRLEDDRGLIESAVHRVESTLLAFAAD